MFKFLKFYLDMVDFIYRNESKLMVILRCIGPEKFFLERAIFPSEDLAFLAPKGSKVEIWGNELYGPRLEQRITIQDSSD